MFVHVRVEAESKEDTLQETKPGYFLAKVRAKAENNMANTALLRLIGAHYGLVPKSIRIIFGHHQPKKILDIPDK